MTIELERRAFVQASVALAVAAAAAPAAAQTPAPAGPQSMSARAPAATASTAATQTPPPAGPKPKTFNVKPKPSDPTKIKGMSEKILAIHYANDFTGAVTRLNQIT